MMADWVPVARTYDPLKAGSIDGTDIFPHDKAIFRAMSAKYKPNKDVIGKPENTIFVASLSPHTDEDALEMYFSKYGEIKRLRLVRDIVTGFSKCYAFIEFVEADSAYKTQKYLDKTVLDEKEIYVDFECERTLKGWIPRRLGGGIGGKKESGQLRFGGKNRPFKKPFKINSMSKPEGETFRERLKVVERGDASDRDRDWDSRRDRSRYSDRDRNRERSRSKERYRKRSRSRERSSRPQDRRRSRSRERSKRKRD